MHMTRWLIIVTSLLANSAWAMIIESAEGNKYDVQTGEPFSPYTAWLASQSPSPASYEFRELRYQTTIPYSRMDKVRAEAIDIFNRYQDAVGKNFQEEFGAALKSGRYISMFVWVGTGPTEIKTRGKKDGEVLEELVIPHHYFSVINPDGQSFNPFTLPITEYRVRQGNSSTTLPFLQKPMGPDAEPAYLDEILGVRDSPLWVAFTIIEMRKEYVDLRLDVFDAQRIRHSEIIKRVIRTDTWNQDSLKSYSVSPQDGNATICFNTTDGPVAYSVTINTRKPAGPEGQSECK